MSNDERLRKTLQAKAEVLMPALFALGLNEPRCVFFKAADIHFLDLIYL
jgi:hypothetical protein